MSHLKIRRRTAGSLIRDRSAELGVEVVIAYEAWSANGGYIIHVMVLLAYSSKSTIGSRARGSWILTVRMSQWPKQLTTSPIVPLAHSGAGASPGFQRVFEASTCGSG